MPPKKIMHKLMTVIIIEYLEGNNSTATITRTAKPINNLDPTFLRFWSAQVCRRYICDISAILFFFINTTFLDCCMSARVLFLMKGMPHENCVLFISFFSRLLDQYEDRMRKNYPRRPTGVGLGRVVLVVQGGGTTIMMDG